MAKITKTVVDKELRDGIFDEILVECWTRDMPIIKDGYYKINDRQYGTIRTDANGVQRYCRIGVIVAEEREDMTAEELMQKEIDEYNAKQAEKAKKAQARAEKAKKDKERRAKEKEEKENV